MRIFVAGATGTIGRRLIPMLIQAGHSVTGMTRSPGKAKELHAAGADSVIADALDLNVVMAVVKQADPEVVIHELTSIPPNLSFRKYEEEFAATNRLRTEGTDNLLAAACAVGARRFIAQSFGAWTFADPAPKAFEKTQRAIRYLESTVPTTPGIEGVVLRYGAFYGPGSAIAEGSATVEGVRKRRFPIIGGGTGVWSFIHVDDAARATVEAVGHGAPGVYNVVDDDPATVSEWLPELALILGAPPPVQIPAWLGRLAIGEFGVVTMTEVQGGSNVRAKRELDWQPVYASWRDGFRKGLSGDAAPRLSQEDEFNHALK